jgi:Flp pilus assembly protein TadG
MKRRLLLAQPLRSSPGGATPGSIRSRRGAAVVEGTIVLSVFLVIIFATCDLGLAVLRQNALAETARRVARAAIVRGEDSEPQLNDWGPSTYSNTAAHDSEIGATVRPALISMRPASVQVQLTWPDGDNATGQRVTARVSYDHDPILPFLFGGGPLALRGESTMRIEH